jgi:hypothetical protein
MEFDRPVRHTEDSVQWFRVPLVTPYTFLQDDSSATRTGMLQALLHSKGLFSSVPTLAHLEALAPAWILPDSSWSPRLRWTSPRPAGVLSLQIHAVWISRSSLVPELEGTVLPSCIDFDFSSPDLEEVQDVEPVAGMVHLRNLDTVRQEASQAVRQLWSVARQATAAAEAAEEAFFEKYGDSVSDDSDNSDESA